MKQVTFMGTGQLNGPVIINKTIELDDKIALSLGGSKRNEIKLEILAIHFPGVKINPSQISCQIKDIKSTNVQKNISSKKDNYNNKKSSFSIFNLLLWLFFFPFKFAWWILKKIWNEKHI